MTDPRKISYSQYSMWSKCPHQWKLKYVDNIRFFDASIDTVFGTAIHETIQAWLSSRYALTGEQSNGTLEQWTTFFREALKTEFRNNVTYDDDKKPIFVCDLETMKRYFEEGCIILSNIFVEADTYFPTHNTTLMAIEYELDIPINDNASFTGFIDILLYNAEDELYTIVDLKTSKTGWSSWQKKDDTKSEQIILYKNFFAQQLNVPLKNIAVEFIILARQSDSPRLERYSIKTPASVVKTAAVKFEHFIKSSFDDSGAPRHDNFPPTPSKSLCKFCVYKTRKELCAVGVE